MKLTQKFLQKIINEIEEGKGLDPVEAIEKAQGRIIVYAKDNNDYTYCYGSKPKIPQNFSGEMLIFEFKPKEDCIPISLNDIRLATINAISV